MKRYMSVAVLLLVSACFAGAQITKPSTDVLGAHLNYGRGCTACHSPHSRASGNGNARSADTASGTAALWGEDGSSLYGKTITTGGGKFVEVLQCRKPARQPGVSGVVT